MRFLFLLQAYLIFWCHFSHKHLVASVLVYLAIVVNSFVSLCSDFDVFLYKLFLSSHKTQRNDISH